MATRSFNTADQVRAILNRSSFHGSLYWKPLIPVGSMATASSGSENLFLRPWTPSSYFSPCPFSLLYFFSFIPNSIVVGSFYNGDAVVAATRSESNEFSVTFHPYDFPNSNSLYWSPWFRTVQNQQTPYFFTPPYRTTVVLTSNFRAIDRDWWVTTGWPCKYVDRYIRIRRYICSDSS